MKGRGHVLRIYADTSVFGGCHDEEFRDDSLKLIRQISQGRILLLVSEVVLRELEAAPGMFCESLKN